MMGRGSLPRPCPGSSMRDSPPGAPREGPGSAWPSPSASSGPAAAPFEPSPGRAAPVFPSCFPRRPGRCGRRGEAMAEKGYILCVDDDLALLESLWQQISDLHGDTHEVAMAKSAEEALGLIYDLHHKGRTVEMIITDLIMPGMGGDRFLEIVHARFPHVVKILLTGHTGL